MMRLYQGFSDFQSKVGLKQYVSISTTMCQHFHITPLDIDRIFKEYSKCSLQEYIMNQKIDEAKRLLLIPGQNPFDVYQKVGFKDKKYFEKIFKQKTGARVEEFASLEAWWASQGL